MDIIELFNIIRTISTFLLILFSIFLLSRKKGNRQSYFFLAGFLIARAFILFGMLQYGFRLITKFPHLAYIETPFLFLYLPMLTLYIRSATMAQHRLKIRDILHLIPSIIVTIFLIFRFYILNTEMKLELILTRAVWEPLPSNIINRCLWIQFVLYAPFCVYLFIKYRKRIKLFYSSLEGVKLSWLGFLVFAFLIWKTIFLTGYLMGILPGGVYSTLFRIFIEFGFLFYASMIVYKGLQLPELFNGDHENAKYRTSPLTKNEKDQYLKRIETCMHDFKIYLDSTLTLTDLSKKISIPSHYVSQILNEELKLKFYDYINKYRIEESKRLLSDPINHEKTVLEILYDVGFNSKSVFNTAFKKHVGMTPTEFRKHYSN